MWKEEEQPDEENAGETKLEADVVIVEEGQVRHPCALLPLLATQHPKLVNCA